MSKPAAFCYYCNRKLAEGEAVKQRIDGFMANLCPECAAAHTRSDRPEYRRKV